MENIRWDVGRGWGYRGGWFGGVKGRDRKGETIKTYFSLGRAVYVHYFNYIRERAPQFDCVMLSLGASAKSS